jgi:hypothetical protein
MNNDPFSREYDRNLSNPASRVLLITPKNEDLPVALKALRVFNPSTNNVTVNITSIDGDEATLTFPPGLMVEAIRIKRVAATGTTAGLIIHTD